MSSFAKQPFCPSSATISAYNAGTLSFLLRRSVAEHLAVCEFCHVVSTLWRSFPADAAAPEMPDAHLVASTAAVPPLPFALRALAENLLGETHTAARDAA
ncbi:MAG TPA: hypothetical protein VGB76_15670 [Pyrinomonadaceae bacterium]|jgi:anti-sigma factor ChrR (cupin superfamily)